MQHPQLLVSSLESLGTLDGPGIRTVFFLQGCPLRCAYCHNPETQSTSYLHVPPHERPHYCPAHSSDGPAGWMDYEKLLSIAKRYRPYHGKKGGLTFSGGEALVQSKTLLDFFPKLKQEGFHLCLDTSGYGCGEERLKKLLPCTDHVILDLKAADHASYVDLCRVPIRGLRRFIKILADPAFFRGQITLRHVCVPGLTDDPASIPQLVDLALPLADQVSSLDVLPYHNRAVPKYKALGMEYRLDGVPEMDLEEAKSFEQAWREQWKKACAQRSACPRDRGLTSRSRRSEPALEESVMETLDAQLRRSGQNEGKAKYNSEIGAELGA